MIRSVRQEDAKTIVDIYNHYIENSLVTFEEAILDTEEMKRRIERISEADGFPYLVFVENGSVIGYAYADRWRTRSAYRYVVESTVYVHKEHFNKGIGSKLYKQLLQDIKGAGYLRVVGGITLPNEGSVYLHEKFGFKKVAHFTKVGFKFDQWADVGFWELSFGDKD